MSTRPPSDGTIPAGEVHQNVEMIGALVTQAERMITRHQRAMERMAALLGRPHTAYAIVGIAAAWIAFNVAAPGLGLPQIDEPPFFWLQGAISTTALLTTLMVLTSQNRQMSLSVQRAHLDLQVNLLTEQKVAKLIALIEELRNDLPDVHNRRDTVAERMQEPVDPAALVSELKETLAQATESAVREQDPEESS